VAERILGTEDKVKELLHSDSNKEKKDNHDHNIQDLWDTRYQKIHKKRKSRYRIRAKKTYSM
jgi:hypothetical protein